jgi:hypothetical protein
MSFSYATIDIRLKGGDMQKTNIKSSKFITTSNELNNVLIELINECESIFISSAWGTHTTQAYKLLLKNKHKIAHFYCGVSGFNTSPEVLKDFQYPFEHFFIVNDVRLFHHKCFVFKMKNSRGAFNNIVLLGSANFTDAGLNQNFEIMQLTEYDSIIDLDDKISKLLRPYSIQVDLDYIIDYERRYLNFREFNATKDKMIDDCSTYYGDKNFNDYLCFYRKYKYLDQRIKLLDQFQAMLDSTPFDQLDLVDRKKIAGLYEGSDNALLDNRWFGSMRRATSFYDKVDNHASDITRAMALIPPKVMPVTADDYYRFCDAMVKASGYSDNPIGIVTRILAMIRPDYFLCVTSQNKQVLIKDFSIKSHELTIENYWDALVAPIIKSPWWNVSRPTDSNGKIWDYRVALLDCLYYQEQNVLV